MDCGLWTWTVDCGLWTVDCGLWTVEVDCGLWTWIVDCGRGLWIVDVDCGLWIIEIYICKNTPIFTFTWNSDRKATYRTSLNG